MTRRAPVAYARRRLPDAEQLAADWLELQAALDRHDAGAIPCRALPLEFSTPWVADDVATQRLAAAACAPCPVLTECRAFGRLHPREKGVLGGLVETDRRPLGRLRRTEAA